MDKGALPVWARKKNVIFSEFKGEKQKTKISFKKEKKSQTNIDVNSRSKITMC